MDEMDGHGFASRVPYDVYALLLYGFGCIDYCFSTILPVTLIPFCLVA